MSRINIDNSYIPQDLYNDEFIELINGLNESIKEYCKVFKHNIKETNNFLKYIENQRKIIEDSFINFKNNNSLGNINELFLKLNGIKDIVNQLQKNSDSNDRNLSMFFEDAKILFKKMKLKRNENVNRISLFRRSSSKTKKLSNSLNN